MAEAGGFDAERQAAITEARRLNRIARYEAERRAEPSLPRREPIEPVDIPIPSDLRGVFRLLRTMCKRLAGLDLEIGRRANEIWANDGWRRLSYASEQQYCEERIGMSLRSVRSKRALARQCKKLPAIGKALASGKITSVQAGLIVRVATPSTAAAWVRRAEQRTAKHLREEIEAAEAVGTRRPTSKSQLAKVVGLEQAVHGLADPGARPPRQLSASLHRQSGVRRVPRFRPDRDLRLASPRP